jgi:hypothetical protein
MAIAFSLAGCHPGSTPAESPSDTPVPSPDQIQQQLEAVLASTFERRLNLREHAAWQILHGALAFQRDFSVEQEPGGERVLAVDYVLEGGRMNGWTVEPGVILDADAKRRGLRAMMEPGSKAGQGHADQWLAVLAQCELPPDQTIEVGNQSFTMADFVAQVQWDVPRNVEREYSWTLIGLTTYLPTSVSWTAEDGGTWSIERLMEVELEQELATSACGGTHRLIGISMALNRHLAQGGALEGVWAEADRKIQRATENARQLQNPDGSFSTHYFERPGMSPDLAQNLGTTGHILEFLTLSLTDEQLREPWVQRAVVHMCELFETTRELPLECGALYHAAHGLALYRDRLFSEME